MDEREFNYKYYRLDPVRRLEIIVSLGLVDRETCSRIPLGLFKDAVQIARGSGRLESLADAVDRATNDTGLSALLALVVSTADLTESARKQIVDRVRNISRVRVPEPFRKCDFFIGLNEDEDGWRDLSQGEKDLLAGVANLIATLELDTGTDNG